MKADQAAMAERLELILAVLPRVFAAPVETRSDGSALRRIELSALARALGLATRELERDLSSACLAFSVLAGWPPGMLDLDEGALVLHGGNQLAAPFPPPRLTVLEGLALLSALDRLPAGGGPWRIETGTLRDRLVGALESLDARLAQVLDSGLAASTGELAQPEVYRGCRQALAGGRRLQIDYRPLHGGAPYARQVSPVELFFNERSWYLKARGAGEARAKSYRLDRISACRVLAERADVPAPALVRRRGPPLSARIRLRGAAARNLSERYPEGDFARDEGEIIWVWRGWAWGYLVQDLLPLGDQALVLEPEAARRQMRLAIEMVARKLRIF